MASEMYLNVQRRTVAATWYEVAKPASGSELLIDALIENWTNAAVTILIAIKSSAPSSDDDASFKIILAKAPTTDTDTGYRSSLPKFQLKDGYGLYMKSSGIDTRTVATGTEQVVT